MKRLLLVLVLAALAISGCTEKGSSNAEKSIGDLKNISISSAENLTSYSVKSSMSQTMKLHIGANATTEKVTTIVERAETSSTVNLSSLEAHALGSTNSQMEAEGLPANSTNTSAEVYQIGNSTYVMNEKGEWTHFVDPRSASEVWGGNNNNQVLSMAKTFSQSSTEDLGSEIVNGVNAYKLKIVTQSGDYTNLYNTAFAVAAKVTGYPMYMPSVNKSELNDTAQMEKTIWISKDLGLPVKYESAISFSITPEIVGAMNLSTGQMQMFNQSIRLGEISVAIETSDLYSDFDKPAVITPPEKALASLAINPLQMQSQSAE
jgi:outer membrane lipoprotein-sorting protein